MFVGCCKPRGWASRALETVKCLGSNERKARKEADHRDRYLGTGREPVPQSPGKRAAHLKARTGRARGLHQRGVGTELVWVGGWHRVRGRWGASIITHTHPAPWLRCGDRVLVALGGTEHRGLRLDWSEGKNVYSPDTLTHPQTPRPAAQVGPGLCLLFQEGPT